MSRKKNKLKNKLKPFKLLFVYGTLRKGGTLNKTYLKNAIYSTQLKLSGIKLYDSNYTPVAVITNKHKNKITGDLYYVPESDIPLIDTLEKGYHKVKLSLAIEGYRQELDVIMYVKKMSEMEHTNPIRIKSGDWITYEMDYMDFKDEDKNEDLEEYKEEITNKLDYLLD